MITDQTVIVVPNHAKYNSVEINGVPQPPSLRKAPFGSGVGCPLYRTVKSPWLLNTSISLKKVFVLPAGATNLRISLSVDNDVTGITLNGNPNVVPGGITHEYCANVDEFLVYVPDVDLVAGNNILVIEANDRGGESFLDMRVLVDLPW